MILDVMVNTMLDIRLSIELLRPDWARQWGGLIAYTSFGSGFVSSVDAQLSVCLSVCLFEMIIGGCLTMKCFNGVLPICCAPWYKS